MSSITALAEKQDLPLWLVRGTNWTYQVASDPEDLICTLEEQAEEAATKAVEIFKGAVKPNSNFKMDVEGQEPLLGVVLEVFLLGAPNDHSYIVYTFIALANGGAYKDSHLAFNALIEEYYKQAKTDKTLNKEMNESLKKYQKEHQKKSIKKPTRRYNKKKKNE